MQSLSPDDRRHVEAAKGWCELQAFTEADAELEGLTPECRIHPDVLEVRWHICAQSDELEAALELVNAFMRKVPNRTEGYLYVASSLEELGRREEALAVLLQAVQRFPRDEIVLYDLACICCLLGQARDAKGWLGMAIEVGGDEIKKRALDDPDLEAVWGEEEGRRVPLQPVASISASAETMCLEDGRCPRKCRPGPKPLGTRSLRVPRDTPAMRRSGRQPRSFELALGSRGGLGWVNWHGWVARNDVVPTPG